MQYEFIEEKCSRARFNACQQQCRIARLLNGGTITDGNCVCEAPIECRFNLGMQFNPDTESQTALFPDVKNYLNQLWSE